MNSNIDNNIVNNDKDTKNKEKNNNKIVIIVLAVLIPVVGICGWLLGSNLSKSDNPVKENNNEQKEEKPQDDEEKEEQMQAISVEEAEKLIAKYQFSNALIQGQFASGYTQEDKQALALLNASDKLSTKDCSLYFDVQEDYNHDYALKGDERFCCSKKSNVISYEDLNQSYKELFGNKENILKENFYVPELTVYKYDNKTSDFIETIPCASGTYSENVDVYGVQSVEIENNQLVVNVGYILLEGAIEIDYYQATIDNKTVTVSWDETRKENWKEDFKKKYLDKLPTYKYVFEKENDNYILVDFYKDLI